MLELVFAAALLTQDSTTTCSTLGGQVTCNTHQNTTPFDAYNAARESAIRNAPPPRPATEADQLECAGGDWWLVGCSRGAHNEAVRIRDERARQAAARDRVMALLRQGDCQGAVTAALDTGDLGFATEVRTFCATGPAR